MSTTDSGITYTTKALEMLSCFMDGFDEVVLDVAEELARLEAKQQKGGVCITAKHVKAAGDQILAALKQSIADGKADEAMAELLADTETCFTTRSCDDDE